MLTKNNLFNKIFICVVIVSGFCSLIYQVIWERVARFNFGGDHTSSTIIIAVFLLGLGVGAYLFGKINRKHLLIYGFVEILIGLFAFISYSFLQSLSLDLVTFFDFSAISSNSIYLYTVVACFIFFLVPCILIGGTLPLMFGGFFSIVSFSIKDLGKIYGFNIAGAMLGTILAGYLILNNLSIPIALNIIGAINIFVGLVSISIYFYTSGEEVQFKSTHSNNPKTPFSLLITFIFGAFTGIIEIILIRHAFNVIPSSAYNFIFVISTVLFSLSIGSIYFSSKNTFHKNQSIFISKLSIFILLGILISVIISNFFYNFAIEINEKTIILSFIYFFLISFPIFFPLGGVFPILCSQGNTSDEITSNTGKLYLSNSFGAFAGILVFHYFLIENFGTFISLKYIIFVIAIVSIFLSIKNKKALFQNILIILTLLISINFINFDKFIYGNFDSKTKTNIYKEGSSGIASYIEENNKKKIIINGQSMGALPDKKHALQLSTALITSKEIKSVLVMGLGTGSYIRYMLENNYIEKVIVVDWSSETHEILVELENNKVLGSTFSDDRVRFINGDARVMSLALKEEKFDLIIDNLVYPTWVGATGVRTPYYFKNIANLLNKDGYFALTTNYARYRNNIISGLFDAFDYVYENKEGFILLSANSEIPFKKDLKNDYNLSHHKDTLLTKSEYDEILLNGFEYLDSKDFEEYKSLSESFLFSEFYLLSIKN